MIMVKLMIVGDDDEDYGVVVMVIVEVGDY